MEITLKGKITSLPSYSNNYGTIFCADYNTSYKFISSDKKISEHDALYRLAGYGKRISNSQFNIGDLVTFSLIFNKQEERTIASNIKKIASKNVSINEVKSKDEVKLNETLRDGNKISSGTKYQKQHEKNTDCFNLDGYTFKINIANQELGPLFWAKTNGLHQDIYLNKSHPKYQQYSDDSFKQVLIALGRSSLSFSDNSGELFFNRMKNYIELIQYKHE